MPHSIDRILILAIILLGLASCQKETRQPEFTYIKTNEVAYKETTINGVTFSASFILENDVDIIEQGFVFGQEASPTLESGIVVLSAGLGKSSFSVPWDASLEPDKIYYVRSFIRTRGYLTYGNEVEFMSNGSKPAFIDKMEPAQGTWGDTVIITGKRFAVSNNNKVYFNGFEAKKTWGGADTLYAIVPDELNISNANVQVSVYGHQSENNKPFEIQTPKIISIDKTEGQYPDTVTIKANGLSQLHAQLMFGEMAIKAISTTKDEVKFRVPFLGPEQNVPINITQLGKTYLVADKFSYHEQSIQGTKVDSMYANLPIYIYAKNFDLRKARIWATVNDALCNIDKTSRDSARITPLLNYEHYALTSFLLKVFIYGPDGSNPIEIYKKTLYHKKPRIVAATPLQTSYKGSVDLLVAGLYEPNYNNSDECVIIQKDGGVAQKVMFYNIVNQTVSFGFPDACSPGNYKVRVSVYNRLSDPITIEIKYPQITAVLSTSVYRNQNFYIRGNYLPNGNYTFVHYPSASRYNNSVYVNTTAQLDQLRMVQAKGEGRGYGQIEIPMGDQTYVCPLKITYKDHVEILRKLSFTGTWGSKNMVCFAKDGYVYCSNHGESTMDIVDIATGNVSTKTTNITFSKEYDSNFELFIYPMIVSNEVFINYHGTIYAFNFATYQWDPIVQPSDGVLVETLGKTANYLIAITKDGKYWRYNGSWQNMGSCTIKGEYLWGLGNSLYVTNQRKLERFDATSFTKTGEYKSTIMRDYYSYARILIVPYKDELYQATYSGSYETWITKFSPSQSSFLSIFPYSFPYNGNDINFCPDVNGDVYYITPTDLFKFNPE